MREQLINSSSHGCPEVGKSSRPRSLTPWLASTAAATASSSESVAVPPSTGDSVASARRRRAAPRPNVACTEHRALRKSAHHASRCLARVGSTRTFWVLFLLQTGRPKERRAARRAGAAGARRATGACSVAMGARASKVSALGPRVRKEHASTAFLCSCLEWNSSSCRARTAFN